MNKEHLIEAIRDAVQAQLETAQAALEHTLASATHDEARPENQYDTRALELTYLAAGQGDRVAELHQVLTQWHIYRPVAVDDGVVAPGALVEVGGDAPSGFCFLAPFGFGLSVTVDGARVQVVTAKSPLGAALLGRAEGDVATLAMGGRTREIEILCVT